MFYLLLCFLFPCFAISTRARFFFKGIKSESSVSGILRYWLKTERLCFNFSTQLEVTIH